MEPPWTGGKKGRQLLGIEHDPATTMESVVDQWEHHDLHLGSAYLVRAAMERATDRAETRLPDLPVIVGVRTAIEPALASRGTCVVMSPVPTVALPQWCPPWTGGHASWTPTGIWISSPSRNGARRSAGAAASRSWKPGRRGCRRNGAHR